MINDKILNVIEKIERQEKLLESDQPVSPDSEDYIYLSKVKNLGLWSVPRTTGEFLNFMVKSIRPKIILELGCSVGYSTLWIGDAAKEIGAHVYTTERFIPKIKLARENFAEAELTDTITLIEGNIKDTIESWDKDKIDYVFMDADKKNYLEYLKLLLPKLNKDSLIIADNIDDMKEHLTQFIDFINSDESLNAVILHLDNGIALISPK